jgi:hypothetical protein
MGFEFNEATVKNHIWKGIIPPYFQRERMQPAVKDWFEDQWLTWNDARKMQALRGMVGFPERIFFILLWESSVLREDKKRMSQSLLDTGVKVMAEAVQPKNKQAPARIPEIPESMVDKDRRGILSDPGGQQTAEDMIKTTVPKPPLAPAVPPARHGEVPKELPTETYVVPPGPIKKAPPEEIPEPEPISLFRGKRPPRRSLEKKQRQVAKKLRPHLTRESMIKDSSVMNVISMYRLVN